MNRDGFLAYIETYNQGKSQVGRFYAPDMIFENPAFTLSGPKLLEFLHSLHGVLEDRIEPVTVVCEGAGIAMFARHIVHALKDANLPIGRFKAGDTKTIGLFAFYETQDDLITHIRLGIWPEGRL